jgi:hypothetical protein
MCRSVNMDGKRHPENWMRFRGVDSTMALKARAGTTAIIVLPMFATARSSGIRQFRIETGEPIVTDSSAAIRLASNIWRAGATATAIEIEIEITTMIVIPTRQVGR